ncbi:hypothetical protein MSG28_004491 [Choristoneura fumiferana]|uniref:Uncharacterized protein n=1 Tax=Choristoneura fumiferana TaxID=7141 RepID=A0ACC0K6S2_CHOFU|nr:hypothetical protein MSG28_004491 [Choristoneura fumiferana]
MSRIITTAEVKKHNHKDSVWMIIHNDVYDVTNFLDEHPGGEETLLDSAGKEASQDFEDGADEEIQDWNIASRGAQPSTNTAIACSGNLKWQRMRRMHLRKLSAPPSWSSGHQREQDLAYV